MLRRLHREEQETLIRRQNKERAVHDTSKERESGCGRGESVAEALRGRYGESEGRESAPFGLLGEGNLLDPTRDHIDSSLRLILWQQVFRVSPHYIRQTRLTERSRLLFRPATC